MQVGRWLLRCGALLLLLTAAACAADKIVLVTSQSSLGANDSASWSSVGGNAKLLGTGLSFSSAKNVTITASLKNANSLTAVVCPSSPCSWTASGSGFQAGDTVLWTSDAAAGGNGPLTVTFGKAVSGIGASMQADSPGKFTASIEVFNNAQSLGTFTVQSNASGDPVFIGALDTTAANITSAVFSLTSCADLCTDFAIDTLSLTVPAAAKDFAMTASTMSAVDPGQTATYSVTITPTGGFKQAVDLACSGNPALTTCTVDPGSVTPDGSDAVKATVTVSTTAPTNAGLTTHSSTAWALYLTVPFGLVVLFETKRSQRRKLLGLLLLGLVALMSGCGGSSSGGGGSPGTAPGTYNLTVTGTSGSLSHSVDLKLTVN
jgi:hypothetical protein